MKYAASWLGVVMFMGAFAVTAVSVSHAQGAPAPAPSGPADTLPDPKFDPNFAQANRLIAAQQPDKAYEEYVHVKNDSEAQNPALAADALLRAALLGYDMLIKPEPADFAKLPPEAQDARRSVETDLAKKSHDVLNQIINDPKLADTQQGAYIMQPHWINIETGDASDLKTALETQIDRRNSRQIGYQIVDKLVNMTGARPYFSYTFALILLAVFVKAITFPLTLRMYKSQREMQKVQPQLKELQERYKGNNQELQQKTMEFYKEHHINPFASCVPMIVQLPFIYYVYNIIRQYEYHFSHGKFLWIGSSLSHQYPTYLAVNLAKFDVPLLVIYALSNYLTMKLNPSPDPSQRQQQNTMSIMMTIMFFFMFMKYQWSSAFILYWLISNFISAFQQYNYIFKPNKLKAVAGDTAKIISTSERGTASTIAETRPLTPVPGGTASRPRPKARKRR